MKNSNFSISVISILFIFGVLVSCFYLDLRKTMKQSLIAHNNMVNTSGIYKQLYTGIHSDNEPVNMNIKLMSYDKQSFNLRDIIHSDSMYLILKYPGNYSEDCIDKICERIKMMKNRMSCIHIIVLIQTDFLREMKIKVRNFKDDIPTYLLNIDNLGLTADKSKVPYVTFIKDGKNSRHTLLINPDQLDILSGYLQTLTEKYCNKNGPK